MAKPEYPVISPEILYFSRKVEVRLLARTLSPLPIDDFSEQEWADLNAAANIAGEAAKTCYSPHLLTPLDYVIKSDKHRESVREVSATTRASGHHSTREHVHYVFGIKNLSRNIIYRLHSQPHHATDQESQRYVTMSGEGVVLPRIFDNREADHLIETAASELFAGYEQLTSLLIPIARELYLKRFPGRRNAAWDTRVDGEAQKRAQEIARYLLPLSMGANLYHSINELTLIRMAKMIFADPRDPEMYALVKGMIDAVALYDPTIREEIGENLRISTTPDYDFALFHPTDPYAAADEFDTYLAGQPIHLDEDLGNLDHRLAEAVRLTVGASESKLSDLAAIDLVLNPTKNPFLASVNGEMVIHQLSRSLNQVNLSANITLSHVIDSQLQRHRALNHTRPLHLPIPRLEQDIVIPRLIAGNEQALELYLSIQARNIVFMHEIAAMRNVEENDLSYLHTNATRIRKRINGPLGAFHHLLRLRTCLNAQEENYNLAVALVKQLPGVSPLIAAHFNKPAPCGIRVRSHTMPLCPEGDHFCGIPVWNRTIEEYPERDI
ncbi:hypothetical protein A3A84_03850 [Candidatus Collierbacteria bacterium RIFCSPLOWO2_01_FULL_50_23]|uniref:Thymidylate synthase n=1 Tax=Candidatus Collierbacteria bacterium RIFCSPHIGHO2_01_FULL_50_25 TaxID=1817722 RepID=A0A1F5EVA1_9BACT|nr:MAG: hypothetical protein A2703_03430 [Candidatus Collierbacteria bacterium RIFCSPHIGHO2_01_FULL_50_25]OGD75304.1 MAG: hypothetical protein A3A84_03850 [Candidatus Collierbacteria bacterium RIFCSPLOWO2_01_FULL_50_23]